MWRKIQFITGALCIALYTSVAVWSGFCVFKDHRAQKERAQKEFASLAALASAAGESGFFDQRFQDNIEQAVLASQTLQAVLLSGPDDRLIAVEKTSGVIRWVNEHPRFNNNPLLFTKPFFTTLRASGPRDVSLSAVASPVDYTTLLGTLRTALFAVLLSAGASFFLLMLGFIPSLNHPKNEEDAGNIEDAGDADTAKDKAAAFEYKEEAAPDPTRGVAVRAAQEAPPLPDEAPARTGAAEELAAAAAEAGREAAAPPPEETADYAAADAFEEALFAGTDTEEKPEAVAAQEEEAAAEEAGPEDAAAAAFLREPPVFDDLDQAFKESFPPEEPFTPLLEDTADAAAENPEEPPASPPPDSGGAVTAPPAKAPPDAAAAVPPAPEDTPPPGEPEPALPLYEGFGDELSAAPHVRRGLLAAASRVYENDIMAEEKESPAFMEALAAALDYAGKEDEDLCLLGAEWIEGEKSAESLAAAARDFFKQDDQVFGRASGGIYCVIPGITLDSAFALAKEFYARAAGGQSEDDLLAIGLSTKAGRRVEAERLLKEAQKALGKAREDDELPIVAFKVDTEKYNRLYAGSP